MPGGAVRERERDIGYEPHDILVYTNDDLKLYKSGTWVGDDFLSQGRCHYNL